MCQINLYRLSCCGHVYRKEIISRCKSFTWAKPCSAWNEDVAKRILADCDQCRQSHISRMAELTREYAYREAAMMEEATRGKWHSDEILRLCLKINGERERAQERLCLLTRDEDLCPVDMSSLENYDASETGYYILFSW